VGDLEKNKGGRPPTYKTKEEMQVKIDEYFENCIGEFIKDENGEIVLNKFGLPIRINDKIPTVTGLALQLGFDSRTSLLNYQGKQEFVNTIMRAKARCEEYAESRLFDRDGAKGAEFSLQCNFKWKESSDDNEKELIAEAEKIIVSIRKTAKEVIK